jgi:hypothetical protein
MAMTISQPTPASPDRRTFLGYPRPTYGSIEKVVTFVAQEGCGFVREPAASLDDSARGILAGIQHACEGDADFTPSPSMPGSPKLPWPPAPLRAHNPPPSAVRLPVLRSLRLIRLASFSECGYAATVRRRARSANGQFRHFVDDQSSKERPKRKQ